MIIAQRPAFRKLLATEKFPGRLRRQPLSCNKGKWWKSSVGPGAFMSIWVTKGQFGSARVWIMCCKSCDLVSYCWFIVFVCFKLSAGRRKSSTLDGKVGKAGSGRRGCIVPHFTSWRQPVESSLAWNASGQGSWAGTMFSQRSHQVENRISLCGPSGQSR